MAAFISLHRPHTLASGEVFSFLSYLGSPKASGSGGTGGREIFRIAPDEETSGHHPGQHVFFFLPFLVLHQIHGNWMHNRSARTTSLLCCCCSALAIRLFFQCIFSSFLLSVSAGMGASHGIPLRRVAAVLTTQQPCAAAHPALECTPGAPTPCPCFEECPRWVCCGELR